MTTKQIAQKFNQDKSYAKKLVIWNEDEDHFWVMNNVMGIRFNNSQFQEFKEKWKSYKKNISIPEINIKKAVAKSPGNDEYEVYKFDMNALIDDSIVDPIEFTELKYKNRLLYKVGDEVGAVAEFYEFLLFSDKACKIKSNGSRGPLFLYDEEGDKFALVMPLILRNVKADLLSNINAVKSKLETQQTL